MMSVLLLSFGGTHSRWGAQKPLLIRILPSHLVVKNKNKTKRSGSQMHPNGVGPIAFLWGDTFSLGGTKISFGTDFALTFRVKNKNKTKRSGSQMHLNGVGPVAFLLGDTFSLGGTKISFGTDFALTFGGEE